jgi:hypothetical protein
MIFVAVNFKCMTNLRGINFSASLSYISVSLCTTVSRLRREPVSETLYMFGKSIFIRLFPPLREENKLWNYSVPHFNF